MDRQQIKPHPQTSIFMHESVYFFQEYYDNRSIAQRWETSESTHAHRQIPKFISFTLHFFLSYLIIVQCIYGYSLINSPPHSQNWYQQAGLQPSRNLSLLAYAPIFMYYYDAKIYNKNSSSSSTHAPTDYLRIWLTVAVRHLCCLSIPPYEFFSSDHSFIANRKK